MDPFEGDTIRYGGRDFPIKPPSFRHVRVIVPAAGRLMPKLAVIAQDMSVMDDALMDDAFAIVHAGVQAGTPELTREQFEQLPCDMTQLMEAVPKVLRIAGLRPAEPATGEPAAGNP